VKTSYSCSEVGGICANFWKIVHSVKKVPNLRNAYLGYYNLSLDVSPHFFFLNLSCDNDLQTKSQNQEILGFFLILTLLELQRSL